MKRTTNVFEAFDGLIGTVIVPGQEFDLKGHKVLLSMEESESLGFNIDGQLLYVDEEVGSTNDFEFDPDNLVLFKEDGYRGEGCYWGVYWDEDNQRMLGIDFVSDGVIYTLSGE